MDGIDHKSLLHLNNFQLIFHNCQTLLTACASFLIFQIPAHDFMKIRPREPAVVRGMGDIALM